jgi:hypothetical protein
MFCVCAHSAQLRLELRFVRCSITKCIHCFFAFVQRACASTSRRPSTSTTICSLSSPLARLTRRKPTSTHCQRRLSPVCAHRRRQRSCTATCRVVPRVSRTTSCRIRSSSERRMLVGSEIAHTLCDRHVQRDHAAFLSRAPPLQRV